MMMHRGHHYLYHGDIADEESLFDFAHGQFHESETKERVPKLPTLWDEIKDLWNAEVRHKGGALNLFLMKDSDGVIHYGALFLIYVVPCLIVYVFFKLMKSPFETDSDTVERTRALEESNRREKAKIDAWI